MNHSLTHLLQRQKAWSIRSYPCTGLGLWLTPNIKRSHVYPVIIERLQSGASFLDIGCFLGQDLRALVVDGAPSNNFYGIDIVSHWELGYEMFRDREKFSARFIEGDILVPNAAMQDLAGKMDVISMMSMLHAWDWETQVRALREVVKLSSDKGGMVVGFQVGSEGLRDRTGTHLGDSSRVYWHSPESFQEMWDQVGKETETKWMCESTLETFEAAGQPTEGMEWLGDDTGVFRFVVVRME